MTSFRVHAIGGEVPPSEPRDDVARYLRSVHLRFGNSIHAQTRVYTGRAVATAYELHWNLNEVPGEMLLGTFGWSVPPELITAVEGLLATGEPVRLFIFNSDADLCFQELLVPEP